jgi:hypothetical protein
MTNEPNNKSETAESRLREQKAYHTPKLVNLGEIHSLVMAGNCGVGDLTEACGAS